MKDMNLEFILLKFLVKIELYHSPICFPSDPPYSPQNYGLLLLLLLLIGVCVCAPKYINTKYMHS